MQQRFAKQTDLDEHQRDHASGKILSCSECELTFTSKVVLKLHTAAKHASESDRKLALNKRNMKSSNFSRTDQMESSLEGDREDTLIETARIVMSLTNAD